MKLPELTPKRRELLGNFFLNIAVVCLAAGMLESNWAGAIPVLVSITAFLLLTKGM